MRRLNRYTYSLCFFGEAVQKSNNNNQRSSLGFVAPRPASSSLADSFVLSSKFQGWAEGEEKGSDAYYNKQLYADGQRCWNGPARSAKVSGALALLFFSSCSDSFLYVHLVPLSLVSLVQVDLICGTTNALLNVAEPEKCTYLFQVSTPAVCIVKDELPVSVL